MNYYTCGSHKGNYPPSFFELNDIAVGQEGRLVTKAHKKFWEDYFVPISRETIPIFRFQYLKEKWKNGTAFYSSVSDIAMHPDYQQIIGMGTVAIYFILREMKENPDQWFWALKAITGEDPVKSEDRGDVKAMTKAWIKWGKENNYLY